MKRTVIALLPLILLTPFPSAPAFAANAPNAETYFLSTGTKWDVNADTVNRDVGYTFSIETGLSRAVLVREIGRSGPGLQLQNLPTWRTTRTIPPHKSISVTLRYHVSDCATVPNGDWPLRLEASFKGGAWHVITMQINSGPGTPEWQKSIADSVCP
jgi:hypothetical protein